ncbi:hypothetical protein [Shouchella clausii]|uniref:hypothetical protein n=1 Tax=Shouchella clausii TaxID=79880 RepID=UPI0032EE7C6D
MGTIFCSIIQLNKERISLIKIETDGGRTGTYTKASEELTTNKEGNSYISYADFAIAVADEVEQASVLKGRFTVVGEEL